MEKIINFLWKNKMSISCMINGIALFCYLTKHVPDGSVFSSVVTSDYHDRLAVGDAMITLIPLIIILAGFLYDYGHFIDIDFTTEINSHLGKIENSHLGVVAYLTKNDMANNINMLEE